MPASSKDLGALHAQLARVLNQMLEPVERTVILKEADEDGPAETEVRIEYPSPAVLAVAAKFLKDNSIFSGVDEDEELLRLKKNLAKRGRGPTDADVEEAVRGVGARLIQ